eukprot:1156987-Pelagomonas_calceolata.AAC.4
MATESVRAAAAAALLLFVPRQAPAWPAAVRPTCTERRRRHQPHKWPGLQEAVCVCVNANVCVCARVRARERTCGHLGGSRGSLKGMQQRECCERHAQQNTCSKRGAVKGQYSKMVY